MKALAIKLGAVLSSVALLIGITSMNTACIFIYHQPEVPKAMQKYNHNK